MQIELTDATIIKLSGFAYDAWCKAFDNLKHVKNLKWEDQKQICPKGDWSSFHAHMLKSAQEELDKATQVKNEICPIAAKIIGF